MKNFTLPGFIAHIPVMIAEMEREQFKALDRAARVVKAEARREIAHYQPEHSPFLPWEPLAESTVDEKERLGFAPPDNPLLRTGELRDSIQHTVSDGEAEIGSNSQKAVWQELGTKKMPPRSFLGGALVRQTDEVVKILGDGVVRGLVGEGVLNGRIEIED